MDVINYSKQINKMDSNQNMVKYAAMGVGAIALGAFVWYLSKDDASELDFSKYTKDKLENLMKEVQLEFTCIYTRNYNILLKIKESDEYEEGILDQVRVLINREMKDKTEQVCEDYELPLTSAQLEAWIEKF